MVCERKECAEECLYQTPVIEVLLAPVAAQLSRPQVSSISSLFIIWFLFFFSQHDSDPTTSPILEGSQNQQQTRFVQIEQYCHENESPPGFPLLKSAFDCFFLCLCVCVVFRLN